MFASKSFVKIKQCIIIHFIKYLEYFDALLTLVMYKVSKCICRPTQIRAKATVGDIIMGVFSDFFKDQQKCIQLHIMVYTFYKVFIDHSICCLGLIYTNLMLHEISILFF